ncbi:MAG TPA: biopolymer transporter ExbD [Gemmatimonadaceae bacterium]|nr:biopolymer transporter ExbD [Gemmatimonadaceae bacterium]
MPSTYFHRTRLRREERKAAVHHGGLNLVPLVDILTSIVFFSLLTYAGTALAALTSFDLTLPPTVIEKPEDARRIRNEKDVLNLLLVVRLSADGIEIEHSADGGFRKRIDGLEGGALDQFETEMAAIRATYPQNRDVLVLPVDGMSYEAIVQVLERLKRARYSGIALGTRSRALPGGPSPEAGVRKPGGPP